MKEKATIKPIIVLSKTIYTKITKPNAWEENESTKL